MHSSVAVLFSSFLLSSVLIIMLVICLKTKISYSYFSLKLLLLVTWLIVIRQFMPVELDKVTITIPSTRVLTFVRTLLKYSVFYINNQSITVQVILFVLWIIGFICYGCILLRSIRKLTIVTKMPHLKEGNILALLQEIKEQMHIYGSISIIQNKYVRTPSIIGIKNPVILLPLYDFSEQELMCIFYHELAHYKNHDNFAKIVLELMNAVFWWNPFFYLLKAQLSTIFEFCADYAVIREGISVTEYLQSILKLYEHQQSKASTKLVTAFCATSKSELVRRFEYMTNADRNNRRGLAATTIVCIVFLYLSFCFTFEAEYPLPENEQDLISYDDSMYIVENPSGKYYLYKDGKYLGMISNINDEIYNDLKKYLTGERIP